MNGYLCPCRQFSHGFVKMPSTVSLFLTNNFFSNSPTANKTLQVLQTRGCWRGSWFTFSSKPLNDLTNVRNMESGLWWDRVIVFLVWLPKTIFAGSNPDIIRSTSFFYGRSWTICLPSFHTPRKLLFLPLTAKLLLAFHASGVGILPSPPWRGLTSSSNMK